MEYEEPGTVEQPQIDPAQFLQAIMAADNVAEFLDDAKLAEIATDAIRGYGIDKESMKDWTARMERGVALASLVKEDRTYPFKGAANVKYPLVTTAALQFNARAYPAVVPAADVVKARVNGKDPMGIKAARGQRVADYMSHQLLGEIEEWEETTDKLLTMLPIVGTVVRKVWFDPALGRPRCRLVEPSGFIVNDRVKSIEDAPRITEKLPLFPSEIKERRNAGTFRDIDYVEAEGDDRDAIQDFIEQHCRLDLDEDGYGEPYIVTVHVRSQKVARIVADFGPDDVRFGPSGVMSIKRGSYYVPYHFLPSMEGGFFSTGFGLLLGDMSDTVNSIINMMLDAGHMAALGGGFIGSEFRIKGGSQQFQPGEWRTTATKGGDIRNAIVPLTFPGPDGTLFQLLGLLIEAAKDVSAVKDVMTGDTGGRQMTATTTLALIEQGMAQFTAAYKRVFRSLKREFRILARINAETLDPQRYTMFHDAMSPDGQMMMLNPQEEFSLADMDIDPVADPASVTKMQEAAKAELTMQLASTGMVDQGAATKRIIAAAQLGDVEELMPKPDPMQEQMMQIQSQMMQADATLKMIAVDQAIADIEKTRAETIKTMTDASAQEVQVRLDQAKMMLEAVKVGLQQAIGGSASGMAGSPRIANGPGIPSANAGLAAGGGDLGLLAGSGMAGSGPAGVPAF